MSLLIIGNRSHQLLVGLVEDIKKEDNSLRIDILSQETTNTVYKTDGLYDNIFYLKMANVFNKFRFIKGVFKQILFRKRIKNISDKYDFIHIHYVEDIILRDVDFFLKNIKAKLIISIWGSDFYRATTKKRKALLKLLNAANTVTIANKKAKEDIELYYAGKLKTNGIKICKFTIKQLYNVMELTEKFNKIDSRNVLKFKKDITTITIGYNASKMQQHLDVINILEKHEGIVKRANDILLVFPLTYPKDKDYIREIKNRIEKSPFKAKVITEFMTDDDVSHLRNATDIMVQVQTTDMFSASMLEHLYAKNSVITGSWLPYKELNEWGISYSTIDVISGLGDELYRVLLKQKNNDINLNKNTQIIKEKLSRERLIGNWLKLYNE